MFFESKGIITRGRGRVNVFFRARCLRFSSGRGRVEQEYQGGFHENEKRVWWCCSTMRGEMAMWSVEKILRSIESLSEEEYTLLRKWFAERDREKWDKQIEIDSESKKLDFLVKEAREEKKAGRLKNLLKETG
jgi:hypothetical protein